MSFLIKTSVFCWLLAVLLFSDVSFSSSCSASMSMEDPEIFIKQNQNQKENVRLLVMKN